METGHLCEHCRKRLEVGMDLYGLRRGVLGHQRFIPLEEPQLFCSDECLHNNFGNPPKLEPRIP